MTPPSDPQPNSPNYHLTVADYMNMREKLQDRGVNWNTVLLLIGIFGALFTAIRVGGPLLNMTERAKTFEEKLGGVGSEVATVKQTQAIQTEALKRLVEIANEGLMTRRQVDRNSVLLEALTLRVEKIENGR